MRSVDVVVGRQPIFDRDLVVNGYELVLRTLEQCADQRLLTADELFGSDEAGLERLTGRKRAFCRATPGVLEGAVPVTVTPERTVIEIPREARVDGDVSAACRALRDRGYTLALEDVTFFDAAEGLLELASIVSLDLQAVDAGQLTGLRDQCHESNVTMVAKQVDSTDALEQGAAMGFDLFQGYLLALPRVSPAAGLEPGRLAQLRMAAQLLDQEFSVAEIEGIVRTDPAMTHQLLQVAGIGAAGGMRRAVGSIREALVLVGWRRLQGWVALLLLTDKGTASDEMIVTTLTRARMAELVGAALDPGLASSAFMAGLLSGLDVLLGAPIEEVMRSLPVTDEVRDAVVAHHGRLGAVVADVIGRQLGRLDAPPRTGLGEPALAQAALDALTWAVEMAGALDTGQPDGPLA